MGGEEEDGESSGGGGKSATQPDKPPTKTPVEAPPLEGAEDTALPSAAAPIKRASPRLVYTSSTSRAARKQTAAGPEAKAVSPTPSPPLAPSASPASTSSTSPSSSASALLGRQASKNVRPPRERKPVPKPSPLAGKGSSEKVAAEINQLARRYGKSFQRGKVEADGSFCVSFRMPIQDPDFPFDLESLHLRLRVPPGYPDEAAAHVIFEVLNDDVPASVRIRIRNRMDDASERMPRGEPSIKALLVLLERNLEKWMVALPTISSSGSSAIKIIPAREIVVSPAAHPLVAAAKSSALPVPVPVPAGEKAKLAAVAAAADVEAVSRSLEYTSVGVPVKKELATTVGRFQLPEHIKLDPISSNAKAGAIQIELEELVMEGVALVIPVKVGVSFRCARCRHVTPVPDLRDGVDRIVSCGGCKQYMELTFLREALHSHSHCLGYLRTKRTIPTDLLPLTLQATCSECTPPANDALASSIKIEAVQVGERISFACRNCHAACSLSFAAVNWTELAAPVVLAEKAGGKALVVAKLPTKIGEPLPELGTCSHYRKSHRWFRFPCCGRAYPCDECHDADPASKGHTVEWASRQICGYCSREFSTAQKYCICGESPAAGTKHTAHWEGGKGTRDQSTMSRKDRKKYRNTEKTVSSKARATGK